MNTEHRAQVDRALLDRANAEYAAPERSETAAFVRLTDALERRKTARPWLPAATWSVSAASALLLIGLGFRWWGGAPVRQPAATLQLSAEPPRATEIPTKTQNQEIPNREAPSSTLERAVETPAPTDERTETPEAPETPKAVKRPRGAPLVPTQPVTAPSDTAQPSHTVTKPEDCLAFAREGQTERAQTCFVERARGNGLGAELALYELARLRRDVLGQAPAALAALAEYRERFPAGSLKSEVDVSRIELLVRLGRTGEALRESEALLASPAGAERSAELHLLRGGVLRQSGELRAAEREYALAERGSGNQAAEAAFGRAQCLEALGDRAGARAAYERAAQPSSAHRKEAERRLRALRSE
jgi:hypothetical protein